jgi:hypothetical protein
MKITLAPPPPKAEPKKAPVEVEMPKVGKHRIGKASFITSIPVKSKSSYE